MKVLLIIMTLFPLLKDKQYKVDIEKCEQNSIQVILENEIVDIELFNVEINKDGWNYVCKTLNDTKDSNEQIEIELDNIQQSVPLKAYVFIDGNLLQTTLIDKNMALIKINNPEYKYIEDMQKSESLVIKNNEQQGEDNTKKGSNGYSFIIILITLLWGGIYYLKKIDKTTHSV